MWPGQPDPLPGLSVWIHRMEHPERKNTWGQVPYSKEKWEIQAII